MILIPSFVENNCVGLFLGQVLCPEVSADGRRAALDLHLGVPEGPRELVPRLQQLLLHLLVALGYFQLLGGMRIVMVRAEDQI